MLAPCPRRRPVAGGAAALAVLSLLFGLAGCAATASGSDGSGIGRWIYPTLASVALAALGYALGTLRARASADAELRRRGDALRRARALQTGWRWRTDAAHRLVEWAPPADGSADGADGDLDPQAAEAAGALPRFDALPDALRAQRARVVLRLRAAAPLAAGAGWELRGVAEHDDGGAFAGYVGQAVPTDDAEARAAAAAAVAPLLAAQPGAAIVALRDGTRTSVTHLNAAAAALGPAVSVGADLGAIDALPRALVDTAIAEAAAGDPTSATVGDWTLRSLPGPRAGSRVLVLTLQPAPVAADGVASETETLGVTVSHDLRAPIRVVEGFTRIVKEDYGRLLDRVGNDHLDRVLGAAARMNLMIDAVMTLARLSTQPLARQPVNLSQLAGWVADDLRRSAPERDAEIAIEPGLAATGDPTLLRQVLENLIGNAWKYSARRERAEIAFRRATVDGMAVFEVRDNGAGFDRRAADRLFGLFQRLHSASDFPGHGVGLASVRRIVRRHGGEIWAESDPGRGATFYFTLG